MKITIKMESCEREIEAISVLGDWAAHPIAYGKSYHDPDSFTVTHVPSGLGLAHRTGELAKDCAVQLASDLADLGPMATVEDVVTHKEQIIALASKAKTCSAHGAP